MNLNITIDDINAELIDKFISEDYASEFKLNMRVADNYYNSKNEIIMNKQKKMMLYDENDNPYLKPDYSKANHKVPHSYLKELIQQCTNHLAGKPLKMDYKLDFSDENRDIIDDLINKQNNFARFIQENITTVQKYGVSYFRVISTDEGIKFVLYDPKEIIMFYDDLDEPTLALRYFTKQEIEKDKVIDKDYVEVYDKKYKDTYSRNKKGKWEKEKKGREYVYSKVIKYDDKHEEVESMDLFLFPIIEWRFNGDKIPTIVGIKPFIDLQDGNLSDLANNVDDIQDAVWILENYNGESIAEFMRDLKEKKAIKVGEGGGVSTEKIEIPIAARQKLYELCEKNIYKFGSGINFSDRDSLGNVSGVALKWSYAPLEQKSNAIENNAQEPLNNFFNIIFTLLDIDYDSNDVEFIFNKTMITNEEETTRMVISASSEISQETVLDNLPFVNDTEEELKRLEEEKDYEPTIPSETESTGVKIEEGVIFGDNIPDDDIVDGTDL